MKQNTKNEISHIVKKINEILDTYTPPPQTMAGGLMPIPNDTGNYPQSTNEQIAEVPPQASARPVASDVQSLQKAAMNASTVNSASKRINTSTEFPQAFKIWFSSLGYNPQNPAITVQRVQADIAKTMREMGYK